MSGSPPGPGTTRIEGITPILKKLLPEDKISQTDGHSTMEQLRRQWHSIGLDWKRKLMFAKLI